jgi:hypothetical protein
VQLDRVSPECSPPKTWAGPTSNLRDMRRELSNGHELGNRYPSLALAQPMQIFLRGRVGPLLRRPTHLARRIARRLRVAEFHWNSTHRQVATTVAMISLAGARHVDRLRLRLLLTLGGGTLPG